MLTVFNPAAHNGGDTAGYVTLAHSLLTAARIRTSGSSQPPHTKYPPVFPALLAGMILFGARTRGRAQARPALSRRSPCSLYLGRATAAAPAGGRWRS
jgi:hypothetical protein